MAVYKTFSEDFLQTIQGVSYVGNPKNQTMMFLAKKIENKLNLLFEVENCLVFVEDTVEIPIALKNMHTFVVCKNPGLSYTKVALRLMKSIEADYRRKRYSAEKGYLMGEDVTVGKDVFIEPGAFIDHDVQIGNGVIIKTGAKIRRNSRIGADCILSENCLLGEPAFNITTFPDGKRIEIPSFGSVVLGNRVYIGPGAIVSRGSADDTIIEDDVKMAALVHVGHDVHLQRGVELRAGCNVSGYCEIGEETVIAMNATIKNRVFIGEKCFIGAGSVVLRNVKSGMTVFGIPAMTL